MYSSPVLTDRAGVSCRYCGTLSPPVPCLPAPLHRCVILTLPYRNNRFSQVESLKLHSGFQMMSFSSVPTTIRKPQSRSRPPHSVMFIRMTPEDPLIFKNHSRTECSLQFSSSHQAIPSPVELPLVRIVTRNQLAEAPRRHFACYATVVHPTLLGGGGFAS